MHIVLEQINRPGHNDPLWKVLLPKEFVPQNKTFDDIQDRIKGVLPTWEDACPTQIVQRDDGIEFVFVAHSGATADFCRLLDWLK